MTSGNFSSLLKSLAGGTDSQNSDERIQSLLSVRLLNQHFEPSSTQNRRGGRRVWNNADYREPNTREARSSHDNQQNGGGGHDGFHSSRKTDSADQRQDVDRYRKQTTSKYRGGSRPHDNGRRGRGRGGLENSRTKFPSNSSVASDCSAATSSSSSTRHEYRRDCTRRGGRHESYAAAFDVAPGGGNKESGGRPFGRKRNDGDDDQKKRFFGYKYLDELSRKEVHDIVVEITKPRSPFDTYLDKEKLNADWLFLILGIVRTVCQSDFKGNRSEVLQKLCKSQFLSIISNFLGEMVSNYMDDLGSPATKKTVANIPTFIGDLYEFYNCLLNTLPSTALEKNLKKTIMLTKIATDNAAVYLQVTVDDAVKQKLSVLVDKYDDFMKVLEQQLPKEKRQTYLDRIADCAPPEDFRELSLYPTYEDLARQRLGFVRPNKIRGAYDSVDHYLDVQFRLLREDFIDPLRSGLRKYLESKSTPRAGGASKFRYDNVRLYPGTVFERLQNSKTHQLGILLNFDPKERMRKMKWERSKRFMHGSLLLFTTDDFRTFFYGTVLDRNVDDLRKGRVLMTLTESAKVDKHFFNTPFLMAESEVFFEPYYLVLKLLRELNDETFPMRQYIVDGRPVAEYPRYLYDFQTWIIGDHELEPFNLDAWPTYDELGLDTFQYEAFQAALTKDFCVIQGPPGTGKTFLGLKIVETIWKNAKRNNELVDVPRDWRSRISVANLPLKLPILVVCYTNHALDQFLEGLLKFTKLIVRVGGQSRSETMQAYNLRGRSNLAQLRRRHVPSETMFIVRQQIKEFREKIDRVNQKKKSAELPLGILRTTLLQPVVRGDFMHVVESDECLQRWLLDSDEDNFEPEYECYELPEKMDVALPENWDERTIEAGFGDELLVDEYDDDERKATAIVNEDDIFDGSGVEDRPQNSSSRDYSLTVDELDFLCREKISQSNSLEEILDQGMNYSDYFNFKNRLREEIERLMWNYVSLKARLEKPHHDPHRVKTLLHQNPLMLSPDSRWLVYWHWVSVLRNNYAAELEKLEAAHRNKMIQYEEYKQLEDLYVVQNADVVGMTTTGAARLNLLLKSLHPAVVVVEEAAEVLEAHIVASLTNRCQHVILIGDHEQLKPSTSVYELSKSYNIDVSLFERMIKNGMVCPTLNVQHRMRPEISSLITPLIYPNLLNHDSVWDYEPIRGIKRNMFFIEHNSMEQVMDDTQSKQNAYEAKFMIKLARYLVQQGYNPENITILTTYTGQMFLLRELKKEYFQMHAVKCIVVDKYQGEENEIILLSLVRSNTESKIGFLNIKNRVCVALSRAKKGLYVIGNMDCLIKNSELWQNIKEIFVKNNAIGKALELYCEKHDKTTIVASVEDFANVEEGGCNEFCGELMNCGHLCPTLCHVINRDHEQIKCREPCMSTCPRNHPCKLFCYQECQKCFEPIEHTLPCTHVKRLPCHVDEMAYLCEVIVDDVSPWCNHPVKRKCHQLAEDVSCLVPCEDRLDCGHACTLKCHKRDDPDHVKFKCRKPCEKLNKNCTKAHICQKLCFETCGECSVREQFQLACGHVQTLPCASDISKIQCFEKCERNCAQCKKKCRKKCWEDCAPCKNKVKKTILDCGHKVYIPCHENPSREHCDQKCKRIAPCGHPCKAMCRTACNNVGCKEIVKSYDIKPLCGHSSVYVPCHKRYEVAYKKPEEFLPYCREPCDVILECGDVCTGTCGKCWQGRLHQTCQKKCGSTLICGHSCKFPCRQLCPPCYEKCTFMCQHSRCPKKCGVPCVPCKEPCEWRCKHSVCKKKCGEICIRKPCIEPCDLKLSCGHDCIGFCGEPCPPLCRICNPEVTDIMFGYEDEENARFVLLVDCNHTIESQALDQHLSMAPENNEIVMKVCPLCKTPITKTLRYMNFVKQTYKHIMNVKKKIFGNNANMTVKIECLSKGLRQLWLKNLSFFSKAAALESFVKECYRKMGMYNRKNPISQRDLSTLTYYRELCDAIVSRDGEFQTTNDFADTLFNFVEDLIERLAESNWSINRQQMLDFEDELRRYHKMVDYCKALENPLHASRKNDKKVIDMVSAVRAELTGIARFTPEKEASVKRMFGDLQRELKSVQSLTAEEKRMVHEAMKSSFHYGTTGHWFTCTKGHYYCITECGGAMQTARCPECGEAIGGANHRYVPTARLASDMDGATRPAWSSGQDIRNYAL